MIRFWKMKNTRATGMVMSSAAASLIGNWEPWLSWPEASCATPFVSVVSSVLCVETMKWLSSFHDPWNDRMTIDHQRRPRHRQHDRPERAEDSRAIDSRLLLDGDRDRLEEVLHDEHAGGIDEQGDDHSRVRVVHAELVDDEELRNQQHHARDRHDRDEHGEHDAAPAERDARQRVARQADEEDPAQRDAEGDDERVHGP